MFVCTPKFQNNKIVRFNLNVEKHLIIRTLLTFLIPVCLFLI
jgi:hypothetical protein